MGDHSSIEWTEATWNPTTGCDKTSPGCDNCYALTLSKRLKAMGQAKYQRDGDPKSSGPLSISSRNRRFQRLPRRLTREFPPWRPPNCLRTWARSD